MRVTRAQRTHLRVRVASDPMQPVDLCLHDVATLLVLSEPGTRIDQLRLRGVALALGIRNDVTQRAHLLLALDDTRVHIFVAADAQPFATDPHTVARNHRLAAQQRAPLFQRFGERIDSDDAGEQRGNRRRPLHACQQPSAVDHLGARAAG
jgi:hypothetical protein